MGKQAIPCLLSAPLVLLTEITIAKGVAIEALRRHWLEHSDKVSKCVSLKGKSVVHPTKNVSSFEGLYPFDFSRAKLTWWWAIKIRSTNSFSQMQFISVMHTRTQAGHAWILLELDLYAWVHLEGSESKPIGIPRTLESNMCLQLLYNSDWLNFLKSLLYVDSVGLGLDWCKATGSRVAL